MIIIKPETGLGLDRVQVKGPRLCILWQHSILTLIIMLTVVSDKILLHKHAYIIFVMVEGYRVCMPNVENKVDS